MIGGNIEATLQKTDGFETNGIGEKVQNWTDYHKFNAGWLDFSGGDSAHSNYKHDVKLQETTHIFITDYTPIERNADDKRLIVNGKVYDVLLIDDPMELHEHLEIYLKYVG